MEVTGETAAWRQDTFKTKQALVAPFFKELFASEIDACARVHPWLYIDKEELCNW